MKAAPGVGWGAPRRKRIETEGTRRGASPPSKRCPVARGFDLAEVVQTSGGVPNVEMEAGRLYDAAMV